MSDTRAFVCIDLLKKGGEGGRNLEHVDIHPDQTHLKCIS